jgi:hypothetical protein
MQSGSQQALEEQAKDLLATYLAKVDQGPHSFSARRDAEKIVDLIVRAAVEATRADLKEAELIRKIKGGS